MWHNNEHRMLFSRLSEITKPATLLVLSQTTLFYSGPKLLALNITVMKLLTDYSSPDDDGALQDELRGRLKKSFVGARGPNFFLDRHHDCVVAGIGRVQEKETEESA